MNISRSLKRLLLIVALSAIVILLSKSLLSKAVKNLNIETQKKQSAKAGTQPALRESEAALAAAAAVEIPSAPAPADSIGASAESSPVATENTSAGRELNQ